ncbi:uncharacterized protein LOC119278144 isoform X1 [Triticum dicoccoides]|uniref:uncharacterized protein LOC119278144 isoform X1 n=1 Tax=Triticum dicoccoides TaxID=85692 RepID=UPI00188F3FFA|nr:uncharacterized protein LOC119278144 isoform X1 [Triticum dicoccoides]
MGPTQILMFGVSLGLICHVATDTSRTRINVVESNEEYMTEEPFEHRNSEKDVVSSNVQEMATNDEGFTYFDDADADENEEAENSETKERKKRKLKYIWNLPKVDRLVGWVPPVRVLELISYDPFVLSGYFDFI